MRSKSIILTVVMAFVLVFSVAAFAEEEAASGSQPVVTVGGHIKMTIFDRVNAMSQVGSTNYTWNRTFGVTFKELNLFINAKINDWLSFEADPKFSQSTGATPSLGKTGPGTPKDFSFTSMGHGKAVMMVELPGDVHMEIGQIHPIFTVEYGKYLFWEEENNGGPFVNSHGPAGAFHDSGIELVKTFNITDDLSLPVYFYILNGMGSVDPNNTPGVMLHIEPTFGPFTLLASAYAAKVDALERYAQSAYLVGFMLNLDNLQIRGEAAKGALEEPAPTPDEIEEGYYIKAMYKVLPWLKLFVNHESDLVLTVDRRIKNSFGAVVYLSDATMLQCTVDIGDQAKNDGTSHIHFTRPSIFVRSTF